MEFIGAADCLSAKRAEQALKNGIWNNSCTEQDFSSIRENKSFITISTGVIEHIIFSTDLTPKEKIYYLGLDLLSSIEHSSPKRSGKRQVRISASASGTMLGIDRKSALTFQKTLEQKGYFLIDRLGVDQNNRLQRNLITPILPKLVYEQLNKVPNRIGVGNIQAEETPWGQRAHLDQAKMFVMVNLKMLLKVMSNANLTTTSKLIWIYCYLRSHISQQQNNTLAFHLTVSEMMEKSSLSGNAVRKAFNQLKKQGFISFEEHKQDSDSSYRKEKRVLTIASLLPKDLIVELASMPDRKKITATAKIAPEKLIQTAQKVDIPQLEFPHQTHKLPHEQSKIPPLCIKPLIKNIINKHVEGDGNAHEVDGGAQLSKTFANSSTVIDEKTLEQEKQTSTKAKEIHNNLNEFIANCIGLEVPKDRQLQMFSNRLSADDKKALTSEAHRVNSLVEGMLTEREQSKIKDNQSYSEFLSVLEPHERFLLDEQLNQQSYLLDLKLLQDKQLGKKEVQVSEVDKTHALLGNKDFVNDLHNQNIVKLGPKAVQHVQSYVATLHKAKDISGDAAGKSLARLIVEVTHFVASWEPSKTFKDKRDKRSFQLTTAGNKIREGAWSTPRAYQKAIETQVNFNLKVEKIAYGGDKYH